MGIVSLLWQCNRKLPVIKPSEQFIRAISRSNEQRKMISLRLEASRFKQMMESASFWTFASVRSLMITDLQEMKQIPKIVDNFSALTFLSLRCDGRVDFQEICRIFNFIPNSVKRLDIHCDGITCSHYRFDHLLCKIKDFNITVESFVLKVNQISRSLVNHCAQVHSRCVLRTITDFIRIMSNIQYVRIVANKSNLESLLDVDQWTSLLDMCLKLQKISLQGMKNTLPDAQFDQTIEEIATSMHNVRQSIDFEIQVK